MQQYIYDNFLKVLKSFETLKTSVNIIGGNILAQCSVDKHSAMMVRLGDKSLNISNYAFAVDNINKVFTLMNMFDDSTLKVVGKNHCIIKTKHKRKPISINGGEFLTVPSPVNYNRPIDIEGLKQSKKYHISFELNYDTLKEIEKIAKLFKYEFLKIIFNEDKTLTLTPHHSIMNENEMDSYYFDFNYTSNIDVDLECLLVVNNFKYININKDTLYKVNIYFDSSSNSSVNFIHCELINPDSLYTGLDELSKELDLPVNDLYKVDYVFLSANMKD